MKSKITVLLFAVSFLFTLQAQDLSTRYSNYGDMVITHLHNASFPDTGRANGHMYDNKMYNTEDHYMDSTVAVFIPKGYKDEAAVDLVIHFHGWNNNVDSTFAHYKLVKQFVESGKNALLVVPEGPKNSPDSYGGKLESTGGFKNFVNELLDTLYAKGKIKNERVGRIILSGHSGGYRVMAYILMRGGLSASIKQVILLDALYADTEKYVYWLDHYDGKLIDIYTDHGGTKDDSENLMADLKGWGIPFVSYNNESDVTDFGLANNRLVFIHTDLPHNEVPFERDEFMRFVKASCLDNIK